MQATRRCLGNTCHLDKRDDVPRRPVEMIGFRQEGWCSEEASGSDRIWRGEGCSTWSHLSLARKLNLKGTFPVKASLNSHGLLSWLSVHSQYYTFFVFLTILVFPTEMYCPYWGQLFLLKVFVFPELITLLGT